MGAFGFNGRIAKIVKAKKEADASKYGSAGKEGKILSAPKTYKHPKMAENRLNVKGSVGGKTNTLG